jgi:hypothetical protein
MVVQVEAHPVAYPGLSRAGWAFLTLAIMGVLAARVQAELLVAVEPARLGQPELLVALVGLG